MDPKIVTDICVPLMTVKYTATLAISTPRDGQNYYSHFFKMKKADGVTPLFNRVQIGLACDACTKAGEGTKCTHKLNLQPAWKTGQDLARQLLTKEQFEREAQGLFIDAMVNAFSAKWIHNWLSSQERCNYRYEGCAGVVFIAIDPSGGSTAQSEMSLVAGTLNRNGELIIIGWRNQFITDDLMEEQVMKSYIAKLRRDPRFTESLFVTMIENQGDFIRATRFAGYFRNEKGHTPPNVYHMARDTRGLGRAGVPTTQIQKKRYVRDLNGWLARNALHILDDLILDGKEYGKKEEGIKELSRQLEEFAIKTKNIPRESLGFVEKKITFTGKDTGPDDRAMVLQILVYWHQVAWHNDSQCHQKMLGYTVCCG